MIQDRHGDAHAPILDQQQTIFNLRGSRSGNMTTIDFTRPQRATNAQDIQIDDQSCPYFVFPVKGGAYETFTQRIQPHVDDPEMSDVGVCISKCPASEGNLLLAINKYFRHISTINKFSVIDIGKFDRNLSSRVFIFRWNRADKNDLGFLHNYDH